VKKLKYDLLELHCSPEMIEAAGKVVADHMVKKYSEAWLRAERRATLFGLPFVIDDMPRFPEGPVGWPGQW
jgi:hypothetical protein